MAYTDCSANYNTFGYDPKGHLAGLAQTFWGPTYVPGVPSQVFGGPPEPPHYGPPAYYQISCLPPDWKPTPPPGYLKPPLHSDPELFDGL